MFVGIPKNFPGSWRRGASNIHETYACLYVRWGVHSWARVTHECHEHWPPLNNDDSTVNYCYANMIQIL